MCRAAAAVLPLLSRRRCFDLRTGLCWCQMEATGSLLGVHNGLTKACT